jgi:predicted MFS family arabinose efflux permease
VALTASLAPDAQRGRAVGLVTSGVVIGILLARFIAGVIADLGGWRMVYLCMAPMILVVSALLRASLPRQQVAAPLPYAALLRSLPALLRDEPLLRLRAALAFLAFAAVNVLWAPLSLPLAAPPLLLSPSQIGLFGLAGLAGALAAGKAGMLADRGLGQWTTLVALVALTVSWGLVALLPVSLTALAIGVIILDFAIQAVHVTNQALIFTLRPEARSRLVAAYMLFYSAGSALGAAASTAAYASAGWTGVCLLGGAISVAALLLWAVAAFRPRSPCLQRESPCGG